MTPRRLLTRHGYSLAEMLTVVAIIGILATFSLPRLGAMRDQSNLNNATNRFTRAVMAARQAAIQRGRHSYFKTNNSHLWVIVDTTGTNADSVVITRDLNLATLYGVEITSPGGLTAIEYDPRGVSTQNSKQVFQFKHTSGKADSLCVSRLGNTIRTKCP